MSRLTSFAGLVAASSLVLGACGGGSGDGNPDAGDTNIDAGDVIDAGDTPDAAPDFDAAPMLTGLDAVCAPDGPFADIFGKAIECNPDVGFIRLFGADLFDGASMAQLCRDILTPQIDSGTVTVVDANIQACVDYVAATDCLELDLGNIEGTPCGDIFEGTVAIDGECDVSSQCLGDAFCEEGKGCGSCENRLPIGASCIADEQCSDGKCNASNECAVAVAQGGACTGGADCAGILRCDPATDTCEDPSPQVGDVCVDDDECGGLLFSLYCEPPPNLNDPSTCQVLPQPGEECVVTDNFDGTPVCDLLNYVWCLPSTNECQAPAVSAAGEGCNIFPIIGAGARQCAAGLICSDPFAGFAGAAGTCLTPGFEGDACDGNPGDDGVTAVCHPNYDCSPGGLCESDSDFTGDCPAAP